MNNKLWALIEKINIYEEIDEELYILNSFSFIVKISSDYKELVKLKYFLNDTGKKFEETCMYKRLILNSMGSEIHRITKGEYKDNEKAINYHIISVDDYEELYAEYNEFLMDKI